MEFLKEFLDAELYAKVVESLKGKTGIQLANIANGEYIPKSKLESETAKLSDMLTQLAERDKQLEALKGSNGDSEALKAQIKELQIANETATKALQDKLLVTEREYALRDKLKNEYKARDVLSVLPHLKQESLVYKDGEFAGLKEQIDSLSKEKGFLFAKSGDDAPDGTGGAPNGNDGDEVKAFDFGFSSVRE